MVNDVDKAVPLINKSFAWNTPFRNIPIATAVLISSAR